MMELDAEWLDDCAGLQEDWEVITRVLPPGWESKARELGAFRRKRGIDSAATLLRVLLLHLSEGCSLRQTAVRAAEGGLAHVSDVALLNRLRRCGDWFGWMVDQLTGEVRQTAWPVLPGRRVRLVDGSIVCEPGATGSTWRLHYAIDLARLRCDEVHVTSVREGETFKRFAVRPGDVLVGDRGLAQRNGIAHVRAHGGDVLVRLNLDNVPLQGPAGEAFALLPRLRQLAYGQTGEWVAQLRDGAEPVRVCALKKSVAQARRAQDKLRKEAKKKQRQLKPATLEAAGYVIVLTTLQDVAAQTVMELYRVRWQIELAFKRLKSLLQVGHLKKTDPHGAMAWLQGKLLVAALIEKLIAMGERFSPWGYGWEIAAAPPLCVARNGTDAFLVQPRSQSCAVFAGELASLGPHRHRITGGAAQAALSERTT
jgi:hypothetical protein